MRVESREKNERRKQRQRGIQGGKDSSLRGGQRRGKGRRRSSREERKVEEEEGRRSREGDGKKASCFHTRHTLLQTAHGDHC